MNDVIGTNDETIALNAEVEILALIPANMEVPALDGGPLSLERRNLILGRNAGLDEVRKAMGVKK
jgi:hypothetical protein